MSTRGNPTEERQLLLREAIGGAACRIDREVEPGLTLGQLTLTHSADDRVRTAWGKRRRCRQTIGLELINSRLFGRIYIVHSIDGGR